MDLMEDNLYSVTLTPEEFHWLWEDIKSRKFHDLADYKSVKLLKGLETAIEKSDKEHVCVDDKF